eukprot:4469635-Alexandrium_andersonii.AAC.1
MGVRDLNSKIKTAGEVSAFVHMQPRTPTGASGLLHVASGGACRGTMCIDLSMCASGLVHNVS